MSVIFSFRNIVVSSGTSLLLLYQVHIYVEDLNQISQTYDDGDSFIEYDSPVSILATTE